MEKLERRNPFRIVWQSKVGFKDWMGPSTSHALKKFSDKNWQNLLIVPLGFTSDHFETLFELDIEYIKNLKLEGFKKIVRGRSLNDNPKFIDALTDIIVNRKKYKSQNLKIRCPDCKFEICNNLGKF